MKDDELNIVELRERLMNIGKGIKPVCNDGSWRIVNTRD